VRSSAEQISAQAAALDFEPHAMEKVARLLGLLDAIATVPTANVYEIVAGKLAASWSPAGRGMTRSCVRLPE